MNKRQKGNLFQDWVKDWLLDNFANVSIHNQKTVSTLIPIIDKETGEKKEVWISKRNDIFGCIDLIAIIPNKKPLFIQATLDTGVTKRLKELITVPWPLQFCRVQLWQKRPDGVIQIKQLTGDNLKDIGKIVRRKYYQLQETMNGN